MRVQREELLNKIDGKTVYVYTLSNESTSIKITNYGGIILSLITPDKFGAKDDIVLGYEILKIIRLPQHILVLLLDVVLIELEKLKLR